MRQKLSLIPKDAWDPNVSSSASLAQSPQPNEMISQRIERIKEDVRDVETFYCISISPTRKERLRKYYEDELASLRKLDFKSLSQDEKIDFLLLQNYLRRKLRQIELDQEKDEKMKDLLPFSEIVINLCEARQEHQVLDVQAAAKHVFDIEESIRDTKRRIITGKIKVDKASAYRAAYRAEELEQHLAEWYFFFAGYHPLFTWWVKTPYQKTKKELETYRALIRERVVMIIPGDEDAIVGDPIGASGLLADLEAEMIPYSPEELIDIGEKEYAWCQVEMKAAATELGYDNWRDALEYVKNLFMPPGEQILLITDLTNEALSYVKQHDLITVPNICEETWRMTMMSPARQKINPFFTGGTKLTVSYPTDTMSYDDKMMSMRGNNIHFSRSTVFHEMIPGHHLQYYYMARRKSHRMLFTTPFWIEGWALYWEFLLWDRGFAVTPENRIGMLFWRMHRCMRIVFSIKFHLREMTPEECVDMLVERVGHERATAEGEVRRSFNGEYSPLYQAGYMLGALQLIELRREILGSGKMNEKEFHDRVMRENVMPIEILRALLEEKDIDMDFKSSWRFYD
jgi:uncharacterized protein (DUF885 family)